MRKTEQQILEMLDKAEEEAQKRGQLFMVDRSPEAIKFWQDLDEKIQEILYSLPEKA